MDCSCSIEYYHDDDCVPSNFTVSMITLQKLTKKCNECNCDILPGTTHERVIGVWDKIGKTFRTCPDCLSLRTNFYPEGFTISCVREGIEDFICESDGEIPESCLSSLTPIAREFVLKRIEDFWEHEED